MMRKEDAYFISDEELDQMAREGLGRILDQFARSLESDFSRIKKKLDYQPKLDFSDLQESISREMSDLVKNIFK